ncbi:prolipoprotein diacylglyceryl transferase family protein [Methylobacterium indicum]|uniref:Uncharacterized protein n=1 Tax=Methylobacterium indicum TaxID=1775910 RepID=A0A8H9C7M1_9HYPH|nr:prolipoprotein diacylglyceryl transferase family protein [Methylobacterium indicum]BCM84856.1 hypothetical protein mvi_33170 [Methylobacterium indicum]
MFLVGYAAARSACELVREPDGIVTVAGVTLTAGQWLPLPMAVVGLVPIVRPRLAARTASS